MLTALTRDVSASIVSCELTHLKRVPISVEKARAEHEAYEAALKELGCTVQRLPSPPEFPDAVFIEDTAIVLDEIAIIARPGAESRRGETTAVAEALKAYRNVVQIRHPGTLDGGDVIRVGKQIFIGIGPRTNMRALDQVTSLLSPHGYEVSGVSFRGCLHLKSAATAVSNDLVLFNPEWVDSMAFGTLRTMEIDPEEPFAANALLVSDRVIHAESYYRTRRRLQEAGITVVPVPAGELAKAEGGVTCCCLLITH